MNIVGVIPARMGSSRFPGKPLAKICGIPMIEHVYNRCKMSKEISDLYVATCDQEIEEAVKQFKGKPIMTSSSHERATDRVAEAIMKIEKETKKKVDVVVMIQGDEPMIFPEMLTMGVEPFKKDKTLLVTNLMAEMNSREEMEDPNQVKVVVDLQGDAMYFSREPIPSRKKSGGLPMKVYKQVCIISFKKDFLIKFNSLEQTPLEKIESVDMLRVLENGFKLKMVLTDFETHSVDTPEDLAKVEKLMYKDQLANQYLKKAGR